MGHSCACGHNNHVMGLYYFVFAVNFSVKIINQDRSTKFFLKVRSKGWHPVVLTRYLEPDGQKLYL